MGHAIFGWIFGYPSLPAFDLIWGGGVTVHVDRSTALLLLVYALLVGLIVVYRRNKATVAVIGVIIVVHLFLYIHQISLAVNDRHGPWNRTRNRRAFHL